MSLYSLPPAIGATLAASLGVFVLIKSRSSEASRAFSGTCFSIFLWLFAYSIAYSTSNSSLAASCAKLACTAVIFFAPFLYHFVVAFLGLKNEERERLLLSYLATLALFFVSISTNLFLDGVHRYFWGYYSKAGVLLPIQIGVMLITWLRCAYLLLMCSRMERFSPRRAQIRAVFTSVVLTIPAMIDFVPKYGIEIYPFGFSFVLVYVFLAAYCIVKHHVFDIRIILRRSLVYSLLVACITSTYLVMVLIMEKWFQGFIGYRSLVATAMVGFLIALGFVPLKNWIQIFVDRCFFHGSPEELAVENEQLRKQVEQTERLKAVSTLAAGMAHEIKNPLSSIKTFAEYLPQKYDDPAFREKFVKIVSQEVDKMNALVHQLLEFARPIQPQLQPVHLSALVQETLDFLHGTMLKKQIQVNTAFAECDEVLADPGQVKQAFLNVLLNSIEAMERPGQIRISTVQQDGHLEVIFSDTGPGISKRNLQHVFDPFYTTKSEGTGLGLSVVHSIVREHGGRVTLQSEVGRGTTVQITLPLSGGTNGTHAHSDRG